MNFQLNSIELLQIAFAINTSFFWGQTLRNPKLGDVISGCAKGSMMWSVKHDWESSLKTKIQKRSGCGATASATTSHSTR